MLNGCPLEIRKIILEYVFRVWHIVVATVNTVRTRQRIAVQFFSIITQSAWRRVVENQRVGQILKTKQEKKKNEMTPLANWTPLFPKENHRGEVLVVFSPSFPCHAFNGALSSVGSALEVAPASVSFISADRQMRQASDRLNDDVTELARWQSTDPVASKSGGHDSRRGVALELTRERERDRNSLSSEEWCHGGGTCCTVTV